MFQKLEKLEKFLFYFFIFSIPFQTRKILFYAQSENRFNEWTTGYLYFTDLLVIGILGLWILRLLCGKSDFPHIRKTDFWLIGFFLIAGLSLITSQNIGLSVYQLIKLAEFILVFLYVKYNFGFFKIKTILKVFVFSGIFQALLAIAQFINQGSLGLKHFEAGIYNANIPGTATFFVEGIKFIRAYGTAPHPNILAISILVSIFSLYILWLSKVQGSKFKTRGFYFLLSTFYFLLFWGLLLSFSRAVILVFIGASLLFFLIAFLKLKKPLRPRVISLFLLFTVVCCLFTVLFWPHISARFLGTSVKEQAVVLRIYYNDIAVSVIKERPFLGLGIGNSVWHLYNTYQFNNPWLYQPVHNIYLLIASEIGIFGLIVFLIFIGKILLKSFGLVFKQKKLDNKKLFRFTLYSLFFIFLTVGMVDHYLWTIQQGSFVFWGVLGLIAGLTLTSPRSLTDKTSSSKGEK